MFNEDHYPPYALGLGYIIRQDITEKLLNASVHIPLLHLEDVYVTGILSKECSIQPTYSNLFTIQPINDTCGRRGLIAENLQDKFEQLPSIVDAVLNPNIKCKCVNRKHQQYLYWIKKMGKKLWDFMD